MLLVSAISGAAFAQALPSDVITVGAVSTSSSTADVPVYIRDVSATPLGMDQPAGSRIQSYSIKVNYAPLAPVQSVTFTRAGITSTLTPTFEASPSTAGSITLLGNFQESTNLIPFTLNGAAPGDLVGHLVFTFVPGTPAGTVIPLTLDPTLTQLTDEGGTPATVETVANGRLTLVSAAVTITSAGPVEAPTLSGWMLGLLAAVLAMVAIRSRM